MPETSPRDRVQNAPTIVIAGAGIGGLTLALTLHQIGIACRVFEAAPELLPLGVGINLQPNAVRELLELGITEAELDAIGIQTREWALVGLNGQDIYSEPRGRAAGYHWPQYSVHRGQLQMLLYQRVLQQLPPGSVETGTKVTGFTPADSGAEGVRVEIQNTAGTHASVEAALLIGADGLHSAVRAQLYPQQSEPHWGGAIMWRGVALAPPIRTGASFVGLGRARHRLVFYPISAPDPASGLAMINWIAEITTEQREGLDGDWNKRVKADKFMHHFREWRFDWLDVPALIEATESIYEYPMIDRDPIPTWVNGPVALLGDAAHVMYPTGSNGASQAIVDARVLGAHLLQQGINARALQAYDQQLCGPISEVVLRNRQAGPFGLLQMVDERCGGVFEDINSVIPHAEMQAFMAGYKQAAGFAVETLNQAPATLPPGARLAATTSTKSA